MIVLNMELVSLSSRVSPSLSIFLAASFIEVVLLSEQHWEFEVEQVPRSDPAYIKLLVIIIFL